MPAANGERIEAARKRCGKKRSELAEVVGLSYKSVYGAERGYNTISLEKAQLIADALGLELADVLATTPADEDTDTKRPPDNRPPTKPKDHDYDLAVVS